MDKVIWKYPLEITDEQTVTMPKVATILHVGTQDNKPYLWALVNPKSEDANYLVITRGTGQPVKAFSGKYIGTYQINNGEFVFHVFGI